MRASTEQRHAERSAQVGTVAVKIVSARISRCPDCGRPREGYMPMARAAEYLGITYKAATMKRIKGTLPCVRLDEHWLVPLCCLHAAMEDRSGESRLQGDRAAPGEAPSKTHGART